MYVRYKSIFRILFFSVLLSVFFNSVIVNAQDKTALVLSGGGARGFAHIGVIKALEEIGFYPDIIIGTSMGAIIGAMYAGGNSPEDIEKFFNETKWSKIFTKKSYRDIELISQKMGEIPSLFSLQIDKNFNIIYPKYLTSTQRLQEKLLQNTIYSEYMAEADFDSLAIPLRIVATDIKTGKSVIFKQGSISKLTSGSSAFPVILSPVEADSFLLVDGGITNNVPCNVAKDMGADFIVAVDMASRILNLENIINPLLYMGQTINTLSFFSDTRNLHYADVLIRPDVEYIYSTDFDSMAVLIRKGYETTQKYNDQISPYGHKPDPFGNYYKNSVKKLNSTFIRNIKFNHNRQTKRYVLNREMSLRKNSLWDMEKVRKSITNLYSTDLFKSVNIMLRQVAVDTADLIVELQEKERLLFSFGANYYSEKGSRAFLSIKYRNLFGRGIDNTFYIIGSNQYNRLAWDFKLPRIFETTLTNYASFYYVKEKPRLYKNAQKVTTGNFSRIGFEANAGIQIRRVGLTSLGLKYEHVNIRKNQNFSPVIKEKKYGAARFIARVLVENTDNYDLPTKGHSNNVFYEHTLRQDDLKSFMKISVNSIAYETINKRYTFSTHINFGYLNSALSYYERFRLGGINSFPGYHQDEMWGNLVLGLGVGLRAPLTKGSYYRLLGIFGNVWNGFDDFIWKELNFGMRAGILIPAPIGPISLDYGFDMEGRNIFYFSIGHSF